LAASRLATAATTQLPELKIAFQFFRPMLAVLKTPMRSGFMEPHHPPSHPHRHPLF
jgi:hypothetical protein